MTTKRSTQRRGAPIVSVRIGGRRRKRSRRAKAGFAAALWTMFAALFGLIAVILDLVSLITALLIVGIVAAVSGIIALIATRREGQGGAGTAGPTVNPRNTPGPTVQTGRRKPIAGTRARACGRSCQTSRQDKSTCDCSCGGANHGRLTNRPAPPKPTKRRTPAGGTGSAGTRKPVNTRKGTP